MTLFQLCTDLYQRLINAGVYSPRLIFEMKKLLSLNIIDQKSSALIFVLIE